MSPTDEAPDPDPASAVSEVTVIVREAGLEDVDRLAPLFDGYRQLSIVNRGGF